MRRVRRLLSVLWLFWCGLACASLPRDSLSRLDYTAVINRWGHVLDGYSYTQDALGLYAYTNRFHDPNLRRWIKKGTVGLLGGRNPFAFVGNNPVSDVDPLGLSCRRAAEANVIVTPNSLMIEILEQ